MLSGGPRTPHLPFVGKVLANETCRMLTYAERMLTYPERMLTYTFVGKVLANETCPPPPAPNSSTRSLTNSTDMPNVTCSYSLSCLARNAPATGADEC